MAKKITKRGHKTFQGGERESVKWGVVKVLRWRDRKTGRYTKKKRGAKKESYSYRTVETGKFASGIVEPIDNVITKKIRQADLNEWDGMLVDAMLASNVVSTVMQRNARMVDIYIEGWEGKTKITIKKSLSIGDITKRQYIGDLMVGKVIDRLHEMGYRVSYPIEIVKGWSGRKTKRRQASAYKILKDVNITFRVRR